MVDPFRWLSPLGISVALFLTIGTIWVVVGALMWIGIVTAIIVFIRQAYEQR